MIWREVPLLSTWLLVAVLYPLLHDFRAKHPQRPNFEQWVRHSTDLNVSFGIAFMGFVAGWGILAGWLLAT